jgi:hypothetical protein
MRFELRTYRIRNRGANRLDYCAVEISSTSVPGNFELEKNVKKVPGWMSAIKKRED